MVRHHWHKDGSHTITFTGVAALPDCINQRALECKLFFLLTFCILHFNNIPRNTLDPKRGVCPITGQRAKYVDPKTNTPYATPEAFKVIRER